jgi:regulator of sigma E protease
MYTILIVAAILVSLVVIHELGHFITAKLFGIHVEEFGIGYPPRAFTFGVWGGTEYTINWIPFGGFVRLWDEEKSTKHRSNGFAAAAPWKQVIVLIAGVVMNLIMAWLLFATALHTGVQRAISAENAKLDPHATLTVTDVFPGSPAAAAGIKPGDSIVSLVDPRGIALANPTPDSLVQYVRARGGVRLTVTYIHVLDTISATATPANAVIPNAPAQPALGIGTRFVSTLALPWHAALYEALFNTWDSLVTVSQSLWDLTVKSIHGTADLNSVVGPIGLVGVVHDASQNGFGTVLALAAFISINLALINSIPVPALDGGRIVLVLLEAIFRRKIPDILVQAINMCGVGLIVVLMVIVTYHDIIRLFV